MIHDEATREESCAGAPRERRVNCCAARQKATDYIRDKARRLRDKAHALEKLADELQGVRLSHEAEEALWEMAIGKRDPFE